MYACSYVRINVAQDGHPHLNGEAPHLTWTCRTVYESKFTSAIIGDNQRLSLACKRKHNDIRKRSFFELRETKCSSNRELPELGFH